MSNMNIPIPSPKAVIIDDEIDTCLLLGMVLKKFGIVSSRAHTLADGLLKVAEEQPMFIFLDNNLPDGVGVEKMDLFRAQAPNAKLFMITAMSNLRELALQSGADGFVEKPLSTEKIETVLHLDSFFV